MTEELLARFETKMDNIQKILQWSSAPLDTDRYDQIYFNISEDELRTVGNAGESVVAYCTYHSPFVEDSELADEADSDAGVEAIVNEPKLSDYLDFVGGNNVALEFYGDPEEPRATRMKVDGDLSATIYLPASQSDYESKQLGIVNLYNSDEQWVKPSTFDIGEESVDEGEPLSTRFETLVSEFEKIIDIVNFDSFAMVNYPVVINDGEFVLDVSDDNDRDEVSGTLFSEDVEGEDVNNEYSRGFENLFNSIGGRVQVGIEQDAPIDVVRSSNDDAFTLRYVLLPSV